MSVFKYLILNISEPTVSMPLSYMAVDVQRMPSSNDMWRWSAGGWMKRNRVELGEFRNVWELKIIEDWKRSR